jgi:chromate transporter
VSDARAPDSATNSTLYEWPLVAVSPQASATTGIIPTCKKVSATRIRTATPMVGPAAIVPGMAEETTTEEPPKAGLRDFLRYFLGLGIWGFGGPIATVGYMQRDLVERRGWLDKQEFLNGVALGQTMPGPLAAQVAMWIGFLQRGAVGAFLICLPFILPSFFVVLAVAFFYVRYHGLEWVQALFYGIAPGVMAIIAIAAVKLARLTNRREPRLWAISVITMVVTAVTQSEIALLFIAAGVGLMLWEAPPRFLRRSSVGAMVPAPALAQAVIAVSASPDTHAALALFFLKAGAFIFGSGLAIVPFLREGVVEQYHWLNPDEFLDAVAMGLITPGPVVITAAFIGYLVGGLLGAAIATVAIFLPIYLGVVVPGPWFIRHRDNAQVHAFVRGATAAAAGAIGGATIVLTRQAVIDVRTALIAITSLVLMWRFKIQEPIVVVACGLAGLLLAL